MRARSCRRTGTLHVLVGRDDLRMSFLTPDLALVRLHQDRLMAEAHDHRIARRRPVRERTPDRPAVGLIRVESEHAEPEASAADSSPPSAA
jgi:hypothetical protein